jgi:hypothetical protein
MMIAALMILIFLCVLIIPLRGPSKNKDDNTKLTKPTNLSKYVVNKDGWLERMNEHKEQER